MKEQRYVARIVPAPVTDGLNRTRGTKVMVGEKSQSSRVAINQIQQTQMDKAYQFARLASLGARDRSERESEAAL